MKLAAYGLFALALSGQSAFALGAPVEYSSDATLRFIETAKECATSKGQFDPNPHSPAQGTCYTTVKDGNTITIGTTKIKGVDVPTVAIHTIYLAADERAFLGKIESQTDANTFAIEIDENGDPVAQACVMDIEINGNQATAVGASQGCDSRLNISGTKK